MSDDNQRWREAIEARLDRHGKRLEEHDGWLRTLWQVVLGVDGHNGLRHQVRDLHERMRVQGMIPAKTMWTAIAAMASIGLLIAAIAFGAN